MWGALTWVWLWRNKRYLSSLLSSLKLHVEIFCYTCWPSVWKSSQQNHPSKVLPEQVPWWWERMSCLSQRHKESLFLPSGWPVTQCHKVQGAVLQKENWSAFVWWCLCTAFSSGPAWQGQSVPLLHVSLMTTLVAPAQKTNCCQRSSCGCQTLAVAAPCARAALPSWAVWGAGHHRSQLCKTSSTSFSRCHWRGASLGRWGARYPLWLICWLLLSFSTLDKEGHWLGAGESNPSRQIEFLLQWHLESLWFVVQQEANLGYFGPRKCRALQKKAVCWEHFGSILSFLQQSG